jgi:hypothetical protein
MGFWSKLGKYAAAAGGVIAAPYTGGASLAATRWGVSSALNENNAHPKAAKITGGIVDAYGMYGNAAGGGGGTTSTSAAQSMLSNPNTYAAAAKAIGSAATASGNNRLNQEQIGVGVNRDNIAGNAQYEDQLLARAALEAKERQLALRDIMRRNAMVNPHISEFNTRGPVKYSDAMTAALSELEKRGLERVQSAPRYDSTTLPDVRAYTPIDIKDVQGATGTKKGAAETIADYAAPALDIYSQYMNGRVGAAPVVSKAPTPIAAPKPIKLQYDDDEDM